MHFVGRFHLRARGCGVIGTHDDEIVAGTYGSYEVMKKGLAKEINYVLVPPSVWDILFELYGGGPPIARMVLPPKENSMKYEGLGVELFATGDNEIRQMPSPRESAIMCRF